MTSRETFEAWADARDATHAGRLRNAANDFDYPLGRLLDECWQAATQRACEAAVQACHDLNAFDYDDLGSSYADAIKEALK